MKQFTTKSILSLSLFLVFSLSSKAQLSGLYIESFEGTQFPPLGWTSVNVLGNAQWARVTDESYDGVASAFMSYQASGGEDWLITPQFNVSTGDSLIFYLTTDYSGYPPDSLVIRVSTTDALIPLFTQTILKYEEGVNYPSSGVWLRCAASLNAFVGEDIYIAFSHYNVDGDGVYIDYVSIGQLLELDAQTNSLVSSEIAMLNVNYIPSVSVSNFSQTSEDFPVTIEIDGGYVSTASSGVLASYGTAIVTFDPFLPTTSGIINGKVYTQLVGDEDTSNDTLYFTLEVFPEFFNFGWSSQTPLPASVWGNAVSFLKSCGGGTDAGYVYSISGNNGAGTTIPDVYRYNTISETWIQVSSMPVGKQQIGAAVIQNKIYIPGGYVTAFNPNVSSYVYDPDLDSWSPIADLLQATGDYAIGTYEDSLIYVVGGYNGTADISTVQIYNANSNSWALGTPFPGTPTAGLRMGIADGTIVLVGGYSQIASATQAHAWIGEIDPLDPYAITWNQLSAYPGGTTGRHAAGVSTMNDGKVYFSSGDPNGAGSSAISSTYAYNVRTQSWEFGPDKITGVSNVSNFVPIVKSDSLYMGIISGYNGTAFLPIFETINLGKYVDNTIDVSETSICEGENISLSVESNYDLSWSPGVLFADSTELNPTINLNDNVMIKLTQTPYYGCPVIDSVEITVNPNPVVSVDTFEDVCLDTPIFTISEGTPIGGIYSGVGVSANSFSPSDAGLGTHTITYTYTDANGCSGSADATVMVSECLGLNNAEVSKIQVYPNPATDFINVKSEQLIERIEVYQMNGNLVNVTNPNSTSSEINVTNLSSGLYMLRVYMNGDIYPYKLNKH